MRKDGLDGKGVSERKAQGLPCVLGTTKARSSIRVGEGGRESWEAPWARYLDEAQGAAGGMKGSWLAELASWEEIGLESVNKPQRAPTESPSSVGHRVGTPHIHVEASVGGKTVPPGGNPVFQSPPPLSLPRDPVQTSTDLRNLVPKQ